MIFAFTLNIYEQNEQRSIQQTRKINKKKTTTQRHKQSIIMLMLKCIKFNAQYHILNQCRFFSATAASTIDIE